MKIDFSSTNQNSPSMPFQYQTPHHSSKPGLMGPGSGVMQIENMNIFQNSTIIHASNIHITNYNNYNSPQSSNPRGMPFNYPQSSNNNIFQSNQTAYKKPPNLNDPIQDPSKHFVSFKQSNSTLGKAGENIMNMTP